MFKQILFYILSLIFSKQQDTYVEEYMIDTKYVPQYIYWIDDINVLLSSYGYTEIINTYSRKSNTIDTCDNCIYGYDMGFVYCKYQHRDINSMDEFSTTIEQYDIKNNLIFSKNLFPTVIPIICKREYLVLKTGDPVLEQNTYLLNTRSNEIEQYEKLKMKERIDGIQRVYITVSKSKYIDKIILLDEYYRLWVYFNKQAF